MSVSLMASLAQVVPSRWKKLFHAVCLYKCSLIEKLPVPCGSAFPGLRRTQVFSRLADVAMLTIPVRHERLGSVPISR